MAPLIYVNDHGFWELRFSVAYRALFGETPLKLCDVRPNAEAIFSH